MPSVATSTFFMYNARAASSSLSRYKSSRFSRSTRSPASIDSQFFSSRSADAGCFSFGSGTPFSSSSSSTPSRFSRSKSRTRYSPMCVWISSSCRSSSSKIFFSSSLIRSLSDRVYGSAGGSSKSKKLSLSVPNVGSASSGKIRPFLRRIRGYWLLPSSLASFVGSSGQWILGKLVFSSKLSRITSPSSVTGSRSMFQSAATCSRGIPGLLGSTGIRGMPSSFTGI
mmetsp:Transcript_16653/g.41211  ORF Transcript_16653/g.41211 Transcript_16653/m.41211 type:complete len:226 (+) Transcript_16653:1860-2537(+)